MPKLTTIWGEELDPNAVHQEYPRPTLVRDSYLNLNGYWEYAITSNPVFPVEYDGKILVPFSPESSLSGVERRLEPTQFLFYRRELLIDSNSHPAGNRLILHFGAVDQIAEVYVNRVLVGQHVGGYLPFSCDITEYVENGTAILEVRVQDLTDTSYHSRGKQKLHPGGMWYTAQSGIWQTVWMESVPQAHLASVYFEPKFDDSSVAITLTTSCAESPAGSTAKVAIYQNLALVADIELPVNQTQDVSLPNFLPWAPEAPNLYDVEVTYQSDFVTSYFAMRKIELAEDSNGIQRLFLNNEPYFQNGLLDQGYWPDGLMTPPSDDALVFDIEQTKALGFNTLRKHIKVELPRWYYHCDRLGMLVWQDMVNGGTSYNTAFVTYLPNILPPGNRLLKDNKYRRFGRSDKAGREQFEAELSELIRHHRHHPSIVLWGPFNEGWGQFDSKRITNLVRKLDPTRLIDSASGWFDQGAGDLLSVHNYFRRFRAKIDPRRAVALTEYGGYAFRIPEHSVVDRTYGYRIFRCTETLTAAFVALIQRDVIANISKGLSATIYTQVSDIEDEVNGIFTYDRKLLKINAVSIKNVNREVIQQAQQTKKEQE